MAKSKQDPKDAPRRGGTRACGDLIAAAGGPAFRRFGFVQHSIVSRWREIVGDKCARVSVPESIRFPTGSRQGGTLSLLVEGAHAPLMQHLGPMIIERVNRFFGYDAVSKLAFRQGRAPKPAPSVERPRPAPVPDELGQGLRAIADPGLRACLESLAGHIARTTGPPSFDTAGDLPLPSTGASTRDE